MNIGFPRDLPVEVLDIIASHLDYDDLRAFNLCSRLLYGVACRHLWEDVGLRITDDERARTVLAGILATKRLHSFIRLCGIDVCIPRLSDNCLGLLARLLAACPLLGCLSLSGPEDSADDPVSLSTAVVAAIGAAPNLRILFLQHVAFTGRWPSRFGSVAARCLLLRGPVAKLARLLQYTAEASYLDLDDAACVAASRHCVVAGNATLRLPQTVALSLGFSGLVDPHDAIKALQVGPSGSLPASADELSPTSAGPAEHRVRVQRAHPHGPRGRTSIRPRQRLLPLGYRPETRQPTEHRPSAALEPADLPSTGLPSSSHRQCHLSDLFAELGMCLPQP